MRLKAGVTVTASHCWLLACLSQQCPSVSVFGVFTPMVSNGKAFVPSGSGGNEDAGWSVLCLG